MIEGQDSHESIGPDVQRVIAQSIPPLDVHSDSTKKDCHVQSPTSSDGLSTPSTIHEEKVRDQDEKGVELPPNSPSTIHEEKVQDQDEKDVELAQTTSTAESVYPPPVKVPTAERRGLFARFSIVAEIEEPKHYPRKTKWFITFIIALGAVAAPLGSAIIFPALLDIAQDLNTTPTVTNLSVAFYMLSMSISPLWWSSFSETLGRRTIYLVSFTLFVLFNILAALSQNISMLVVTRLLGGGAAASVQAVGAGTIADIWEVRERGRAMGFFYLGPLMGPLFAPILGGVLTEKLGWRSTLWALVIYGGILLVTMFFAQPETLKIRPQPPEQKPTQPVELTRTTSSRQKVQQETSKLVRWLKRGFLDPLKIILYLRFPAVAITVYYASITFGSLYLLNISLETTFAKPPYSFNTIGVGLTFIPNSVGYILASSFGGKWTDSIMAREARKANRKDEKGKWIYTPADRMRENAWIAAFMYPAALIWYGWTAEKGVHWIAPLLANFFFGIGSMLIFGLATTMLTEFMPKQASSGVAVNNFVRNLVSCVGTIVAEPWISAIGNGWVFTTIGIWAMASCVVVWAMRRYGERWRIQMEKDLA